MNKIFLSEGGKGGVGKSMMTSLLIHHLDKLGEEIAIIDTDGSNPDVYKAHHQSYTCELQGIDSINQWANFLTLLDKYSDKAVVVNMAARNQDSIKNWGETIKEISDEIQVFFMLNTQKDSILLLKDYAKTFDSEKIIPTKNLYFGDKEDFALYDGSGTKKIFKKEFYLDKMLETAATKLYSDRIPLKEIARELNVGERIFFQRWLSDNEKRLAEVLENGQN